MKFIFVGFFAVSTAFGIDFKNFHSQAQINDYLKQMTQENPTLVRFERLGESDKNREINYILMTKANPATAPAIYLNGTHHGNEKSSTETILALIDTFLSQKDTPEFKALLEQYVFIFQPLVNADGHAANTREDANGRDPNRDYNYPGHEESQSFKTKGIRLVREVLDKYHVKAAVAYHSGMEGVLWPWCATSAPTSIQNIFHTLSKLSAQAMGMDYYVQSYSDYPSDGEFIDYVFMKHETLGVTFEVSNAGNPSTSDLDRVVKRAVQGTLAFIRGVRDLHVGRLALELAPDRTHAGFNPLFVRLGRKVE